MSPPPEPGEGPARAPACPDEGAVLVPADPERDLVVGGFLNRGFVLAQRQEWGDPGSLVTDLWNRAGEPASDQREGPATEPWRETGRKGRPATSPDLIASLVLYRRDALVLVKAMLHDFFELDLEVDDASAEDLLKAAAVRLRTERLTRYLHPPSPPADPTTGPARYWRAKNRDHRLRLDAVIAREKPMPARFPLVYLSRPLVERALVCLRELGPGKRFEVAEKVADSLVRQHIRGDLVPLWRRQIEKLFAGSTGTPDARQLWRVVEDLERLADGDSSLDDTLAHRLKSAQKP